MSTTQITIPDLGGASDVEVIELCVAPGDTVAEGDSLIVLETDKASMEIPAPQAGVIKAFHVSEGSTCNVGDLLADMEAEGGAAEAAATPGRRDQQPPLCQPQSRRRKVAG